MKKQEKIFKELKKSQLFALLTPKSAAECVKAYEILHPLGIFLEITFRSEYAADGIKAVLKKYPDAFVFAGTVMTAGQAEAAINAGACGIVSADYIPAVIDICVEKDVICIPGGLSDVGKQLAQKAEKYGCSFLELRKNYPYQWIYKLFPAFSGKLNQMDLINSWKGPYRDLTVVYAGGITLDTFKEAVKKDPQGIFCASNLTKNIADPDKLKKDVFKVF